MCELLKLIDFLGEFHFFLFFFFLLKIVSHGYGEKIRNATQILLQ